LAIKISANLTSQFFGISHHGTKRATYRGSKRQLSLLLPRRDVVGAITQTCFVLWILRIVMCWYYGFMLCAASSCALVLLIAADCHRLSEIPLIGLIENGS
jgi:hypothetical protein